MIQGHTPAIVFLMMDVNINIPMGQYVVQKQINTTIYATNILKNSMIFMTVC